MEEAGSFPIAAWSMAFQAMALAANACSKIAQVATFAAVSPEVRKNHTPFHPAAGDHRFRNPMWRSAPWDVMVQSQLALEQFWQEIRPPGLNSDRSVTALEAFATEKMVRAAAPSNFLWSNPVAVENLLRTRGKSLLDGTWNWVEDSAALISRGDLPPSNRYKVGEDIAATPGSVVFRNELIELIQYAPSTSAVRCEPVLIIPAWIMKYYILDLSPHNSLIRHLVDQGFTVFCASWKNPTAGDRNLTLDDYRTAGVLAAVDAVGAIAPDNRIHAVGYCAGGTILSIAAAAMARDGDDRLASLTLFAAQTDFEDPGEVAVLLGERQVALIENVMNVQGYLDPRLMAAAFHALRADDLVWAPFIRRYLLGEDRSETDLDAWFRDGTRLPAKMHGQYLRLLYVENRLAQGTMNVAGRPVRLRDICLPLFVVGAERDHIAPWRSVFRGAALMNSETTFVLSGGGHNSAIVSPPGKPHAFYRVHIADQRAPTRDWSWTEASLCQDGSWWPEWVRWLEHRSTPDLRRVRGTSASQSISGPLLPAPGANVLET